jgi:hypothetical protein
LSIFSEGKKTILKLLIKELTKLLKLLTKKLLISCSFMMKNRLWWSKTSYQLMFKALKNLNYSMEVFQIQRQWELHFLDKLLSNTSKNVKKFTK